ncbi:O-methyltransferase [Halobacillus fulvus]|nr:O-methyltransferase [Halobacillus fulvus]
MSKENWQSFDHYMMDTIVQEDEALRTVHKRNTEAGLPSIDVSPIEGKFLHLLTKMKGAKRILEIGTLGGYSTIWMARTLPDDGQLITLEYSEKHAAVAQENIQKAGLSDRVEIIVGAALDSLPKLHSRNIAPFDFIFIDADKRNNPHYIEEALKLSEPGTCIVVDNVVREGKVLYSESEDSDVKGIRKMFEELSNHPRIDSTAVQTVGMKGHDGFLLAIVK